MEEKVLLRSEQYDVKKIIKNILIAGAIFALIVCNGTGGLRTILYMLGSGDLEIVLVILLCFILPYSPFLIAALLLKYWVSRTEMVITEKRVYGTAIFGKRVDLPLDSVSAVGRSWPKGIAVGTSSGKVGFPMIKNADEIHQCVSDLLIARQEEARKVSRTEEVKQPVVQPVVQTSGSSLDDLKKLKELLDSGIITQEEFDAKKKQILGL